MRIGGCCGSPQSLPPASYPLAGRREYDCGMDQRCTEPADQVKQRTGLTDPVVAQPCSGRSSQLGGQRILDASLNRANEGLRVAEDYLRFVLEDAHLTGLVKRLRHGLAETGSGLPWAARYQARDTRHDVGTKITTPTETRRVDTWDVCLASLERVKQSLRSLEEYSKVSSPELAARFEALRYQWYTIEAALGRTTDALARLANTRVCVLIDGRDSAEAFSALATSLMAAGVGMLQLRDKHLETTTLVQRARLLGELAAGHRRRPLVIVNDRADIAAAANVDGVHLGQTDMGVKDARTIVGCRQLVGVSTHTIEQARAAVLDGANYLGVGPTFPSSTKRFDELAGLDFLRQVAAEIRLPAFAIGGITAGNLAAVLATGIRRVATSGAVLQAAAPAEAAKGLLNALQATAR